MRNRVESGHRGPGQLARFLLVGCSNFVVSFAVFYFFYRRWPLSEALGAAPGALGRALLRALEMSGVASIDAAVANLIGYSAGIVNSFVWNKLWTFRAGPGTGRQLGRFVALNLASLLLGSASLFLFVDLLGRPYLPVWLLSMGALTGANFLASRHWVFR